jgi:hypothetical protein
MIWWLDALLGGLACMVCHGRLARDAMEDWHKMPWWYGRRAARFHVECGTAVVPVESTWSRGTAVVLLEST